MKKAVMKLPKMKSKKVWIGGYFNHYNAVVIFNKRPRFTEKEENHIEGKWIDLIDDYNKKILAGCTGLHEFKSLFPSLNLKSLLNECGNMKSLEPQQLIECELTAMWENKTLKNIDFSFDGYQSY